MKIEWAKRELMIFLPSAIFGVSLWPWIYLAAAGWAQGTEPFRGFDLTHRHLLENVADPALVKFVLLPYGLVTAVRLAVKALRTVEQDPPL